MRRLLVLLPALLLGLCLFMAMNGLPALADVGNFNDYDSGSSFDGGSSFDYDWGSDYDDDYSSSGSSYSGDSDFSFGGLTFTVIIIIIVFAFMSKSKKGAGGNSGTNYYPNMPPPQPMVTDMTQSIEAQIRESDPDFSSQKFLSWAEEVFMTLQDAWTKREWKMIRPFECEALFNKHSRQLEEYIRNNTINVVERVCINQSILTNYSKDNQYEYLTVYLKARMNDYIIDATTKQVVKGDKNREFHTNYYLKFMRSLGVKTSVNSGKSTTNCPNCGAPTQITSAGECEYCNSVITTGNHDWVLCDLDAAH